MTLTSTDDMSEKTVEMDFVTPMGSENIMPNRSNSSFCVGGDLVAESSPYISRHQGSPYQPSYMAPTQSAKAKVKGHDLLKNRSPSSKKGLVNGLNNDSSSSGGRVVATYQAPRSPNTKGNVSRLSSKWGGRYSPDSSSEERMILPLGGILGGYSRANFV